MPIVSSGRENLCGLDGLSFLSVQDGFCTDILLSAMPKPFQEQHLAGLREEKENMGEETTSSCTQAANIQTHTGPFRKGA